MKRIILVSILAILFLSSCKKKAENPESTTDPITGEPVPTKFGEVKLEFQHYAGGELLALNKDYVNASNEKFKITELKYYVSNVKLIKNNGSRTSIPDTYFLIDASKNDDASIFGVTLRKVPEGNYTGISFLIGVDSTISTSGALAGDLSPELNPELHWVWEGYTGLYFTGASPASTNSDQTFAYRIFGFKGVYNALQTVTINFGSTLLMAKQNAAPSVHVYVDILEFFKNPNTISIAKMPETQREADSTNQAISRNYVDMFSLAHIHN